MNPLDFLQSVAGFAQAQPGFDIAKMRMATIDPAYSSSTYPGTLPKVTFDGETSLSGKRYPVMSPYLPTPGDRVVMVPLGATYLIIGPTDQDASLYVGGTIEAGGEITGSGGADISGTTRLRNPTSTSVALASITSSDSFDRVRMDASGALTWGPGNATRDTNLYRSASGNKLVTDDDFEVGGALTVGGVTPGDSDVQVFTSSGTWNKPSGAKRVWVRVQAGGGAGGGAASGSGNACGGGGGAGGYCESMYDASALTSAVAITVGSGGAGVAGGNGGDGGTSSFGAYCSADGGSGGFVGANTTGSNTAGFGAGGAATGGNLVNVKGGSGTYGRVFTNAHLFQTQAGDSVLGAGGATSGSVSGNGNSGSGYGGGGGNAIAQTTSRSGGNGAPGLVIVTTFF